MRSFLSCLAVAVMSACGDPQEAEQAVDPAAKTQTEASKAKTSTRKAKRTRPSKEKPVVQGPGLYQKRMQPGDKTGGGMPKKRGKPNHPDQPSDLTDDGLVRCDDLTRRELVLFQGTQRTITPVAELTDSPDAIIRTDPRHVGEKALPLSAVLGEGAALEVWPCKSSPVRMSASQITEPNTQWLLIPTKRGFLKIRDVANPKKDQVRNIAAIVVLSD